MVEEEIQTVQEDEVKPAVEKTPSAHELAERKASQQEKKREEDKPVEEHKAHTAQWKKDRIKELKDELAKYKTIAVVNMMDLPSKQLQKIRSKIKSKAKLFMTRKRLLTRALDESKPEHKKLIEHLEGMPALILSNENPFELFNILKQNMSKAPAKTGQIAPEDIVVSAGPTPFAPGPILGEIGAAGIDAGISGGKIVIKADCVVVKKGEPVPAEAANILARLDITPMKIGINLLVALEEKQIFLRETLDIDTEQLIEDLKTAYQNAFKLSVGTGIITEDNVEYLLREAATDAKKLSVGAHILTDETKEHIIQKAESHAQALKEKVPDQPAPQVEAQPKAEEAPEEPEAKPEVKESQETEQPEETVKETQAEESEPKPTEPEQPTEEQPVEETSETPEEAPKEEPQEETEEPTDIEEIQESEEKTEESPAEESEKELKSIFGAEPKPEVEQIEEPNAPAKEVTELFDKEPETTEEEPTEEQEETTPEQDEKPVEENTQETQKESSEKSEEKPEE